MKIAILADPVDTQQAGIHSFTVMAIKALIRNRGSHEIILIRQKKTDEFENCTQYVVKDKAFPPGYDALRIFHMIPRLVGRLNVDVVIHPAHFGPFNIPAGIKRVTIMHDLSFLITPQYHRWHSQFLQRLFIPRIFRQADLIVTNSKYTTHTIVERYPQYQEKTETLLLGKNPAYYPDESRSELLKMGIDASYIHFLGTIEPRKDLKTLLEAYRLVRAQSPHQHFLLVIAGARGWKNKTFEEAYHQHPYREDIILPGRVSIEAARQLHTHSLGLIYPSLFEGFGLPILEAFSCGARVITADNTSLPEVGGSVAHYFKTGNAEELADLIAEVIDESASVVYKQQALDWSDSFSWDKYARSLLERIETLEN